MAPSASAPRTASEPHRQRPFGTDTVLLILLALLFWLAALLELCVFLPAHGRLLSLLGLKLPVLADDMFTLARWFNDYWWAAVVGAAVGLPALALVTWWVRHRQPSRLLSWVWCAVLLLPPLIVVGFVRWVASATDSVAYRAVHDRPDPIAGYLGPDGRLLGRLTVRESRPGAPVEALIIEPGGEWRLTEWPEFGKAPRRQGRLTPGQVVALARHLAAQQFADLPPELGQPQDPGGSIVIDFENLTQVEYFGASRRALRTAAPPADPVQAQAWSRLVGLLLAIDNLVAGPGAE
jgi:hypothetical protein